MNKIQKIILHVGILITLTPGSSYAAINFGLNSSPKLSFSKDGSYLAVADTSSNSVNNDGRGVAIYDTKTQEKIFKLGNRDLTVNLSFSPTDNNLLIVSHKNRTACSISVWDISTKTQKHDINDCGVFSFTNDGNEIIVYSHERSKRKGKLSWWNINSGEIVKSNERFRGTLTKISPISGSERLLVSNWSSVGSLDTNDLDNSKKYIPFDPKTKSYGRGRFTDFDVSDDGKLVVVVTEKKIGTTYNSKGEKLKPGINGLFLFNAATGELVQEYTHSSGVRNVKFTGNSIVAADYNSVIYNWDYKNNSFDKIFSTKEGMGSAADLSYSPQTKTLAASGSFGLVKLFEPSNGKELLSGQETALLKQKEAQAEEMFKKELALQKGAEAFRNKLEVGDTSHCGLVIEVKPPIAKIQTAIGEHWLKVKQLYPANTKPCRFVNGIYQDQ